MSRTIFQCMTETSTLPGRAHSKNMWESAGACTGYSYERAQRAPQIPGFTYLARLNADVYSYEQDLPRRRVVIKILRGRGMQDAQAFIREANTMAALSAHPAIVTVYQVGYTLAGEPYLALEKCRGQYAQTLCRTVKTERPRLSIEQVLDVGVRMCGALQSAHAVKVLHRDVKPANILAKYTGAPALSDFGVARGARGAAASVPGALSLPWAAPEVVLGETTGTVASEIWSLAATLYTFAAGMAPFARGGSARVHAKRICSARVTPLTARLQAVETVKSDENLSSGTGENSLGVSLLEGALCSAMQKNAAARYASMAEFAATLKQIQAVAGLPVTSFEVLQAS